MSLKTTILADKLVLVIVVIGLLLMGTLDLKCWNFFVRKKELIQFCWHYHSSQQLASLAVMTHELVSLWSVACHSIYLFEVSDGLINIGISQIK
ncbi:hypothetical protein CS303_13620 [Lactiplantibacillus plantarum]|nr:hypothetical protein [Lactiplantibacillus plantarum]PHY38668.1 hypothetical protein CS313_11840 [Lactiplantibacillus plantarum]PHY57961.1 hypothetical protein CS303_13620 [Lactiplantibacillus plantarum]